MLVITGSSEGELNDQQRPLVVAGSDVPRPHQVSEHSHRRRQLLYASGGLAHVRIGNSRWSLSHNQGIWVPENIRHEVSSTDSLSYRSVFVDPVAASRLPLPTGPVAIPGFLRELIGEAAFFGTDYESGTAEYRLVFVLYDQLAKLQQTVLSIALPKDARLHQHCKTFQADPSDDRTLEEWADACGMSSRTLARIFQRETGGTFSLWRERVRLLWAIDHLRTGASVTSVALDLGYKSPSAFSAMFRRVTGTAPSRYLTLNA